MPCSRQVPDSARAEPVDRIFYFDDEQSIPRLEAVAVTVPLN